jgi:hypothetical protein
MARAQTGTNRPYIKGESKVFAMGDAHPEWREKLIVLAEQVVSANAEAMEAVVPTGEDEPDEDDELDEMVNLSTGEVTGNKVKY